MWVSVAYLISFSEPTRPDACSYFYSTFTEQVVGVSDIPDIIFAKPTHPIVSLISTQPLWNKLWVSVTYPISFFAEPTHPKVSPYFYSTFTEQVAGVSDIPLPIFF